MNWWPFKKAEPPPDPRPQPPCGNFEEHYRWKEMDMTCPICAAHQTNKREEERLEKQADLIAEKLYQRLKDNK